MDKASYTLREFRDKTGLGRNSALQAIHSGELKAFRVGSRKWLIPHKSLEQWIEAKVAEARR